NTPDLFRRERYWRVPKWELVYEGIHLESPKLLHLVLKEFPHQELAEELVEHYFRHVNSQFSLLNKRLIYRQLRERLHEKDIWFCALLMCIFALGSRWSNHPRVLPRDPQGLQWSMSGWDFLNVAIGIPPVFPFLLTTATLFEVQTLSLLALYLQGHAEYAEGRIFVTVGLQKAQDVGAHRKRVYKHHPTPDEEQWKRAFWLLVVLDRTGSANLGRPCSIGEEDFDLDLPLEVDDQYWDTEDPTLAFKQPPGVPSTVSAFKLWIQITSVSRTSFAPSMYLIPKDVSWTANPARSRNSC
ncbi:fungal-specific transcription factor domain-containing protein, partial [Rhodocollybia butyracea]